MTDHNHPGSCHGLAELGHHMAWMEHVLSLYSSSKHKCFKDLNTLLGQKEDNRRLVLLLPLLYPCCILFLH